MIPLFHPLGSTVLSDRIENLDRLYGRILHILQEKLFINDLAASRELKFQASASIPYETIFSGSVLRRNDSHKVFEWKRFKELVCTFVFLNLPNFCMQICVNNTRAIQIIIIQGFPIFLLKISHLIKFLIFFQTNKEREREEFLV